MSLPEVPTLVLPANGTPQSSPEPEVAEPHVPALSLTQRLELVKAKLRNVRLKLDETTLQLLHSRICYQSEVQSRQTLQRGLNALQQQHLQLARTYRSIYEEDDHEKTGLREDLRIANELIDSQKQLIDIQSQQQQQPASHLAQGGPLLSQYSDHSSQYRPPYQPHRGHEFVIDPASLGPLSDLDYSIGPPIEPSRDTNPAMSAPVAQFEEQTPNLSGQFILAPTSAERDAPGPTYTQSDEKKRGPEDEGPKPNKKRKTTK